MSGSTLEMWERPLVLESNPVYTFYEGGAQWREWRGERGATDSRWAEDWVGSTIPARASTPDDRTHGHSLVRTQQGGLIRLQDLIEAAPEAMLGDAAVRLPAWGVQVKLVSPKHRVPLHTHPDAELARRYFDSNCGKAEAWIVLGTLGDSANAFAGLGFKEDVSYDKFARAVEEQDRSSLINMVHETSVRVGDVVFVPPRMPHYISGATFFVEIQEPADLAILAEWGDDLGLDRESACAGLPPEAALECFDVVGESRSDALQRTFQEQSVLNDDKSHRITNLLTSDVSHFFRAHRLDVRSTFEVSAKQYYIGVVTSGSGRISGRNWSIEIQKGQTFVCPSILEHRYDADPPGLTLIQAFGPRLS